MKKLLITGATGFIGSHLTEQFSASGEYEVSALVRPESSLSLIDSLKVNLVPGDILDLDSLLLAVKGMDLVIHNAALARDWGPRKAFDRVNGEGTRNLFTACLRQGVPRIIMTGTNSVYGEEDNPQVKTEESPFRPHHPYFLGRVFPSAMNHYRESKTQAVIWAQDFAREKGLNLTILEPVWVFGPRERHTGFYEYLKSAQAGTPFAPGIRGKDFALIYVKDLAQAYLRAAQQSLPGVTRFLISSEQKTTLREFHERLCKAAGIRIPALAPRWLMEVTGFFLELLWTFFRRPRPPALTRGRVALFYDEIRFSGQKAREILGFKETYAWDEAIDETVNWYKSQNWL